MADALTLLREYYINGQIDSVTVTGDRVEFGDRYGFPKNAPTAYKSQKGRGEFYKLDALLSYVQSLHKEQPHSQYLRSAQQAGVGLVSVVDRGDLEAYITGKRDSSDYIQLAAAELLVPPLPQSHEAGELPEEPAAKRARLEGVAAAGAASTSGAGQDEYAALRDILARERQLRDRNTMLSVPGHKFDAVLEVLAAVQLERQRRRKLAALKKPAPAPKPVPIPIKPSGRFDRLQQSTAKDTTVKDMGFDGMDIQTYGFRKPDADEVAPPLPSESAPAEPVPAPRPTPQKHRAPPPQRSVHHSSNHRSHHQSSSRRHSSDYAGGVPLIIVPSAISSKLNMFNAKFLLEDGMFKTVEECKAEGVKKQQFQTFNRSIGRDKPVAYHVTDKAPGKADRDWKRVVAVFALGKDWQFKDWPFKGADEGNTVDIFQRMLGIYLAFHDETVGKPVTDWNVKVLTLHRENRHRDVSLVQDFYRHLDAFLAHRKSTLAY